MPNGPMETTACNVPWKWLWGLDGLNRLLKQQLYWGQPTLAKTRTLGPSTGNSKSVESNASQPDDRLSRIETLWSVVRQAHADDRQSAGSAQQQLIDRYGGAIRRYLRAAVRNDDVADDLFQEFSWKFIKGDFKSADPAIGRFRHFIKTVLFRMVATHYRRAARDRLSPVAEMEEPADQTPGAVQHAEQLFRESWRDDVLARTWEALAEHEQRSGVRYHTILRLRVENPAADTEQLAELISESTGKQVSGKTGRVQVHRAREKFGNLLIETLVDSLPSATRDEVEAELAELQLIDYCRDSLDAYQGWAK